MKLTSVGQLNLQLQRALSPIYLISGDEFLLKQEAISYIEMAAQQANFIRKKINDESDAALIYANLYASSLLAEKYLYVLSFNEKMPDKAAQKVLSDYANQLPQEQLLIISLPKLDAKTLATQWYQSLDSHGYSLQVWPLTRDQLPQWILQRAKQSNLMLEKNTATYLAEQVEGNLLAAQQTIEKLSLLNLETKIDMDALKTILHEDNYFNVYDLTEYLFLNTTRTLHILNHLKQRNVEPVLILWAITRECRMLIELAEAKLNGKPIETLFKSYKIFYKREGIIKQILAHFLPIKGYQLLQALAQMDSMIKGFGPGNVWDHLEIFILRCQPH